MGMASFLNSGRATIQGWHVLPLPLPSLPDTSAQGTTSLRLSLLRTPPSSTSAACCTTGLTRTARRAFDTCGRPRYQLRALSYRNTSCSTRARTSPLARFANILLPTPPASVPANSDTTNSYPCYLDIAVRTIRFRRMRLYLRMLCTDAQRVRHLVAHTAPVAEAHRVVGWELIDMRQGLRPMAVMNQAVTTIPV
jgi:hypothetical protein